MILFEPIESFCSTCRDLGHSFRHAALPTAVVLLFGLAGCGGGNNSNSGGGNSSNTTTVTLTATPTSTTTGASVTLAWAATNAASVSIDNGIGTVSTNAVGTVSPSESGTVTVYPYGTTTWTATATSIVGLTPVATATATVQVTSNGAALILYYIGGNVWIVESDGTGPVQIASGVYTPAWFADHQSFIAADDFAANMFRIFTTNGSPSGTKLQNSFSVGTIVSPEYPTPSPDGKTIVFLGFPPNTSGHQSIYTVNADGTGLTTTPLYQNPNGGSGLALDPPRWSHDGKLIVHNRIDTNQHSEVWVMNADGTNPRQVTNTPGVYNGAGAFSADDTTIFFNRCASGSCQIWKISSDGTPSTEALLIDHGLDPDPSPDGKSLVYMSPGISVSDVNGNNQKEIVANGYEPSW